VGVKSLRKRCQNSSRILMRKFQRNRKNKLKMEIKRLKR